MITIDVTGDRGEGVTITAMRIVSYFRSLGMEATYQGFNKRHTSAIDELLRDKEFLKHQGVEKRCFVVKDTAEISE